MKAEKISIKWKLFTYLLLFIFILLGILWLFQICYLNSFYKLIKTSQTKIVQNKVIDLLKSDASTSNIQTQINNLAAANNISIFVADPQGNEIYNAEFAMNFGLRSMSTAEFDTFYKTALDKEGSAKINYNWKSNITARDITDLSKRTPQPPKRGHMENVIYVNIITVQSNTYVLLIDSALTPIDATVDTLKIQLISISVLMVILSLMIAFLMSKKISKSIIHLNNSAKELAKGNFNITFKGRDYLEIAELSDTLTYATKELGQTEQLRRELIANVSHDLRTPLTMIIAYSEGMRDLPGENSPENIQVIIDESKHLTDLVNDMLDISKLQAGVMELSYCNFNITESILTVLARYNKLIEQEGYNIYFIYDEIIHVNADKFKIDQIIYNLMNNALNYTGADKTVHVIQIKKQDVVRIEIKDSGEGIAKEDLPYVWDRYYKVDKTHKRAISGTGLGLSIVKNILELHKASYGVESEWKKGSTFWFEIPYETST